MITKLLFTAFLLMLTFVSKVQWFCNSNVYLENLRGDLVLNSNTKVDANLAVTEIIEMVKAKVTATVRTVADYVFASDDKLRALNSLKAYIKANYHPTNIPDALEVEKNAPNLRGIRPKLLEKIEKLTLYIIDQEKDLKTLKNQNQVLQEKFDRLLKRTEKLEKRE